MVRGSPGGQPNPAAIIAAFARAMAKGRAAGMPPEPYGADPPKPDPTVMPDV